MPQRELRRASDPTPQNNIPSQFLSLTTPSTTRILRLQLQLLEQDTLWLPPGPLSTDYDRPGTQQRGRGRDVQQLPAGPERIRERPARLVLKVGRQVYLGNRGWTGI